MSYLYIRYEDDDLTEYEFYDEINALMEKRGLNVDEDYMRSVRIAQWRDEPRLSSGHYVILLEGEINQWSVDTSHAPHAYPILKQVWREMMLKQIGI